MNKESKNLNLEMSIERKIVDFKTFDKISQFNEKIDIANKRIDTIHKILMSIQIFNFMLLISILGVIILLTGK